MANDTFEDGQRVFTSSGEEVEFAGYLNGVTFIRHVFEDYDHYSDEVTERVSEPVQYRGELFSSAPVYRLDEQYKAAAGELEKVCSELEKQQALLVEACAKTLDMEKLADEHEDFRLLVDFLEGRITHVLRVSYGLEIIELSAILSGKDSYESWPRAIGLFAVPNSSKGRYRTTQTTWQVNQYKDGSGNWSEFIPCRSLEEAHRVAQNCFDQQVQIWRDGGRPESWMWGLHNKADWVQLPDDWAAHLEAKKLGGLQDRVTKAREELQKAEADLARAAQ
ncbi:hypothetical protein [Phaeobacter gallaeciensis]|uniref:hypothetical protein n=1 Tax=Phaeobacter gallaeciensis TaxID=60890 RepID=UPI00237EEE92|nr:hypothetical protein [Phaeobacter gallaeciensis]MDE4189631.1 hypothetical protein [Phaeobacter gallaeciensis]MDE4198783.1 hypothetical protein [Phaeobacter gallaeciensis]MDE4202928.1 hypothetical protein [Phaeobacter gallaeciensis]MDE4207072.1 hypothetical protein [Phaeobacter gallaeciensis]MDE4215703.1 hypothetical protein [Phaeobacter gallaeciensis]